MHDVIMFGGADGDQRTSGALSDLITVQRPQNSLARLFTAQVPERYAPPRAICWEGEPSTHVFHLLEGCLRVSRTMEDGRRAILGFGYADDLLCLSACDTYLFTAEAVTPIRFKRLSRHRFNALVEESGNMRTQLQREVGRGMKAAQDQIVRLGRTGADERVAGFFLDVAQRAGACTTAPVEIEVPFGRLDIADHLGLTVETISREISKLKHDGLISMDGPHRIVLQRVGRLRKIARMDAAECGSLSQANEPQQAGVASP